MELRIKPFPKNSYPKKGLLIKGSSPSLWLKEMEILGIDLQQVKSFAIPYNEPNQLYGCLLIFQNTAPSEIGRNAYFQCVDNKLFIPENTIFYPKINPEDWQNTDSEYLIMHPEFGLVKLSEQINWISLLQEPEKSNIPLRKPLNGVKIPQKIESYTVEMDDEKIMEALQTPQTEEEWMKNLPFDKKKVMAGNKKEIEKYLKYIEKYPDRAVDLGVPLDIMGTSRGDGFGKFSFNNSWLGKLLGRDNDYEGAGSSRSGNYRWIFWAAIIALIVIRFVMSFNDSNSEKNNPVKSSGTITQNVNKTPPPPPVAMAIQSGVTDIDMKIDSMYGEKRRELTDEYMKGTLHLYDPKNDKSYEEYLQRGGRPIKEIQKDIFASNEKVKNAEDSLRKIYKKKIVSYIEQNKDKYQQKIRDSFKNSNFGKPVGEKTVKSIWKKKQILVEDSLGRLYGTVESPPMIKPKQDSQIKTIDESENYSKKEVSFSEIIWLIIFMTAAVGIYLFVVRRRNLNMGGENVPVGIKIFLMTVLLVMLAYLFYPLIEMFGYNWFVWILIICVVLILYRLFSEDKTILNSDKDE